MKKRNKIEFFWNEQIGEATCIIHTKDKNFIGIAKCHPEDQDMLSEKTGNEIAYSRALIEAYNYRRNCIIKPGLKALNQLYYSMKHSKKFNKKSYEMKMLYRQIQNFNYDLTTINKLLATEKENLKRYIASKEEFYKKIRKNRNGQE